MMRKHMYLVRLRKAKKLIRKLKAICEECPESLDRDGNIKGPPNYERIVQSCEYLLAQFVHEEKQGSKDFRYGRN